MKSPSILVRRSRTLQPLSWRMLVLTLSLMALSAIVLAPQAALAQHPQSCIPAAGCGYDSCATPAMPVPTSNWGTLKPVDTPGQRLPASRDVTAFSEYLAAYTNNPYFYSIDIQNGYAFALMTFGVQIFNLNTDPNIQNGPTAYLSYTSFPFWATGEANKTPLQDIAFPAGNDTLGVVVGMQGPGTAIIDTTNKSMPRLLYQNGGNGTDATAAYAAQINGTNYAFTVNLSGPGAVHVFNMDAARALYNSTGHYCAEAAVGTSCPGVYVGQIGTGGDAYISGVDHYIVVSSGSSVGYQVWDVSSPASPVHAASGLSDRAIYGVAMWKDTAGNYYVAGRAAPNFANPSLPFELNITNANCISNHCVGTAPTMLSTFVDTGDTGTQSFFLTFSRQGDGTPFLYMGSDEDCGSPTPQREYLLNVSNPSAPTDITPPATASGGYWGWYYRENVATGFNYVMPRRGKFFGNNFYRVAQSIFDIHQHVGATAPNANFTWNPSQIYPGTPVTFSDESGGTPTSWSWTFSPDGTSANATAQNPTATFASAGPKSVSLTAINGQGRSTATLPLTVLSAQPAIGSISVSPPSPLQCQPVTLTGTGVTGEPPLTYAWAITENTAPAPGGTSSATSFTWDTAANAASPGTYTAQLGISGVGTGSASASFTLGSLPSLPLTFTPTAGTPDSGGKVIFGAGVAGATQWNWNFGDGTGYQGWTNDPVNGPNPPHTYAATGNYTVTVQVRNCLSEAVVTSSSISVNITSVTKLTAGFAAICAFAPCAFTAGSPITFTDSSTGATTWDYDWNGTGTFADAGHAAPVTQHTYATAGSYSPTLRVHNGSQIATYTISPALVVYAGQPVGTPTISVGGATSGTTGTAYNFSAAGSNCTPSATWAWNITGGGTVAGSSTSSSIVVTWATAGSWSVSATNAGCAGAFGSRSIVISTSGSGTPPPTGGLKAVFSYSPTSPNAGATVSFNGSASTGSPQSYAWYFGDSNAVGATTAQATHVYAAAGNYTVKLDVSVPGTGSGCILGTCVNEATATVTVNSAGGAPPPTPLSADFTSSGGCTNLAGFFTCPATASQSVTLTATETRGTTYSWGFGDGLSATGATVTHTWQNSGDFAVTLTVSAAGFASQAETRTFQVAAAPAPTFQTLVLPWIAETRGALVQSSDLYLFNPGTTALPVTLQFLKRGTPQVPPPQATVDIQPGATLYAPDVLENMFQQNNIAGFLTVTVPASDPLPIITSFNTVVQTNGNQFGQTVPGLPLPQATQTNSSTGTTDTFQYLIGLNNNGTELAYFGVSNPSSSVATYTLQLLDNTGTLIGQSNGGLTLSPYGQRQFQEEDIETLFGVTNASDYRVSIENTSSSPLFPYGENVRTGSQAPTFITPGSTSAATQYVIGAFSTAGAWQTDVVLANPSTAPMAVTLTFTRTGVTAPTTAPVKLTLQPGETQRLANAIAGQWNLNNTVGVITVTSSEASGPYPLVQAESYNNVPAANRYGQSMRAFSSSDAASVGQSQYLVGLRQDNTYLTSFWIFNPSTTDAGIYDVTYRTLDGALLGTVSDVALPPGKVREFLPTQHPLPAGGVTDGFTVQIQVKNGQAISAAQVLTVSSGAPAYVQGAPR